MSDAIGGLLRALTLAVGVGAAGWFVGHALTSFRAADRYVTVKGISEREVQADVAIWPLRISTADDDLAKAHAQLEASVDQTRSFLSRNGIDPNQAQVASFSVIDARANQFRSEKMAGSRYVINQTLIVRSSEPDKVRAATEKIGELVAAGVVLSSGGEYQPGGPTFIFTQLNSLKPQMIAEATARAREAAEQFARDSGSRVGGIRRANQGTFEILARDQAPGITEAGQLSKTVRVVSTVEYLLEK
ncbi:MAG TPA: SIMPL domain-containing protein [Myxococcota bacterium]|nr:SIMPL domain-containing protein [Myxococcota bacterium]